MIQLTNPTPQRIFFISPENLLREYLFDSQWRDGSLNELNIVTRADSLYLWAVSPPSNRARPRVGYLGDNGELSEVAYDGTRWVRYVYSVKD